MSHVKHSQVISSLHSKFEQAKSSGAVFFYPSTRTRVNENGFNFVVSTCPALQKKPVLPAPDFTKVDKPDPFAPPYVPELHIGDLKDEVEGDEYAVLLNKFSVIPGHFLMVTKGKFEAQPVVDSYNYMYLVGFQPQNSPLTPSDLTQAYLLVRAARNSSTPIFAFYNCGANSGASQPHKHIQFIPLTDTEATDENEEDEESSRPPVEAYIRRLKIEDETKVFALPLPYVHLVKKLELPQSIVSGNKTPSGQVLEELRQKLTGTFLGLLDEAVHAIRLYHDSQSTSLAADDTGRASVPSYNVLLTSEHMHLIPRLREDTVEELHPAKLDGADEAEGDAAVTPQRLSINSLGFAGMLLAKSDAQSQAIKARGVVELLAQVGVPRVEDKSEGHSA